MTTPSTQWKETPAIGEEQKLLALAEVLREVQRKNANKRAALRGLHAKVNLGLTATLQIESNLPPEARVGIFAEPRSYKAYVRFSNGAGRVQHDAKGDVRGVAIKVLGVPGKKLIPGLEDAPTQDFLLIQTPAVPFRSPEEFVGIVQAVTSPAALPGFVLRTGLRRFLSLGKALAAGMSRKVNSLATSRYWSALPIQWGSYAVHYSLKPTAPERPAPSREAANFLGGELSSRLKEGPLVYELQIQFFVDDKKTPIEDPTVEWKESDAPFITVAKLTIEPQNSETTKGLALGAFIEKLSFDPWHAPTEFRPLGQMMRARNHAYRLSTMERGASKEPDGTETF